MTPSELKSRAKTVLGFRRRQRRSVTFPKDSHNVTLGSVRGTGLRRFSRQRYTVAEVIEAIENSGGLQYRAAEIMGCAPSTLYNYIHAYPEIEAAYIKSQGHITNMARSNVAEAIADEGDLDTSKWWLGRRAPEFSPTAHVEVAAEIVFRVVYDSPSTVLPSPNVVEGEVVDPPVEE